MGISRNRFEESATYEVLNRWIDSILAEEYIHGGDFIDEGDTYLDYSFDEVGFNKAKKESADMAWYIFNELETRISQIANCEIFDQMKKSYDYVVLGTLYAIYVEAYPNIKKICGNSYIVLKSIEEQITRYFLEQGIVKEWLNLYSWLRPYLKHNSLPVYFQNKKSRNVLEKLINAGYLDDDFKPLKNKTPSIYHLSAIAYLINYALVENWNNVKWKKYEELWKVNNLRQCYNRAMRTNWINNYQDEILSILH